MSAPPRTGGTLFMVQPLANLTADLTAPVCFARGTTPGTLRTLCGEWLHSGDVEILDRIKPCSPLCTCCARRLAEEAAL